MSKYDASSIKVLKGLEAVRKRPGMYIGSTDENGLHHLVSEIVDNAMDETLAGFANTVKVTIKDDSSIIVEDNGRGIPIDIHKDSNKSGVELIFTELHAGGKFGQENSAYKISGGLNGVGSSVVNALSSKVEVVVYKDGKEYLTVFENGLIVQKTSEIGTTTKKGTKVRFWPDYKIFKKSSFNYEIIAERLREASFLIAGVEIILRKEGKDSKSEKFKSNDGIKEFIEFINESKNQITKSYSFKAKKFDIDVELGFQYTNDYNFSILSFVNNIKTKDGGTHVDGFKSAWSKTITQYARDQKLIKEKDKLEREDILEGLTAIVSVRVSEDILGFVGQTKDALRTPEAKKAVEEILNKQLIFWLQENKVEARKVVDQIIRASKARIAARKARLEIRTIKSKKGERKILSGKLTPAQTKKKGEAELFLVEGDSAGGSAKLGRDRKFQAILPLRGKVINSEKAKLLDILKNEEIATIINTIGAGVGNDFKAKDVHYGKIVIMTDADTDGAHIQTLLLTFLFRYMRPLFEDGKVFIALPPLYKVTKKNKDFEYAWDEAELDVILSKNKSVTLQRYKGLGEMNADQLWETTMNPESRTLIKVSIDDAAMAERRVSILMGEKVEPRKKWINNNVKFSLEDNLIEI